MAGGIVFVVKRKLLVISGVLAPGGILLVIEGNIGEAVIIRFLDAAPLQVVSGLFRAVCADIACGPAYRQAQIDRFVTVYGSSETLGLLQHLLQLLGKLLVSLTDFFVLLVDGFALILELSGLLVKLRGDPLQFLVVVVASGQAEQQRQNAN